MYLPYNLVVFLELEQLLFHDYSQIYIYNLDLFLT